MDTSIAFIDDIEELSIATIESSVSDNAIVDEFEIYSSDIVYGTILTVTGPIGPVGPKGDTGPQGNVGLQGIAGEIGPTGQTGPVGNTGLRGETGPQGDVGNTGPQGNGVYLRNEFQSPSAIWLIPHNLGRFPSVATTSLAGELFYGDINHLDINTLQISFSIPTSGIVILTA